MVPEEEKMSVLLIQAICNDIERRKPTEATQIERIMHSLRKTAGETLLYFRSSRQHILYKLYFCSIDNNKMFIKKK